MQHRAMLAAEENNRLRDEIATLRARAEAAERERDEWKASVVAANAISQRFHAAESRLAEALAALRLALEYAEGEYPEDHEAVQHLRRALARLDRASGGGKP
jgi:chromosome segregation ATPase